MEFQYQQRIGGEWRDAVKGGTWSVLNPATEEVLREVPFGDAEDCGLAIEAAAGAFHGWSRSTAYERAAILKRASQRMRDEIERLALTTVRESGKPMIQARGEWNAAADLFEWFAEECKRAYGRVIPSRTPGKRVQVLKQPIGVVGVITAWNFPAYNVARATAAALAAGCTVVVRASEYTPLTAMEMVSILVEESIPAGVVNLVNGEPHGMAQAMLDAPEVAKIHFTGSQRVGRLLMDGASRTVTRLSLELGGNAPVLVLPDADVAAVATSAVVAKFRNGGQVCLSPQRFLLHEKLADEFAERVSELARALKIGSGEDAATNVGPLINAQHRQRVERMVEAAAAAGAELRTGGRRPENKSHGYFYEPTVMTATGPGMAIFDEEIFGPVLPMTSFTELEEAVELANRTRYGLCAYVWTQNLRAASYAAERLEFGIVGVNDWVPQATEAPFTGWKESGVGRESGPEGLEEYLETKLVSYGA